MEVMKRPGIVASCAPLHADEGLSVVIERTDAPDDYYLFTACMRGPNVATERATAMAILNSARLAQSAR